MPSGCNRFGSVAALISWIRSLRVLVDTEDAIDDNDAVLCCVGDLFTIELVVICEALFEFDESLEIDGLLSVFDLGGLILDSALLANGLVALVPPALVLPLCKSEDAKLNVPNLSS